MLILARKWGERVRILLSDGRELWIKVHDIDRNKVRLAFDAPEDCRIDREELLPKAKTSSDVPKTTT